MFELNQLEQLIAIEEYGTISGAAEHLNISQPALSRSIQRLEEELEVKLFERQRNKLTFNEEGIHALEYAKRILELSGEMKESLVNAVKARSTIRIGSIAPAPMWSLTPEVSRLHPEMAIQSELSSHDKLEQGLTNGDFQIIITNDPASDEDTICVEYCEEDLYIGLPPAHPLASRDKLSLSDLNGQSVLQYTNVGFWLDLCKAKMPDSLFLMQSEAAVLEELRRSSALPSFATNLTMGGPANEHRIFIPLTDDEVNVIFYIKYKKANKAMFQDVAPLA